MKSSKCGQSSESTFVKKLELFPPLWCGVDPSFFVLTMPALDIHVDKGRLKKMEK